MSCNWKTEEAFFNVPENWCSFKENDFNNWLAENLDKIPLIGNNLELVDREYTNQDNKRLDILAKYQSTNGEDEYIAIESQINKGDFDHFGRLLMYMATVHSNTTTGVFIVKELSPEMKKTIQWINDRLNGCDLYVFAVINFPDMTKARFEILAQPDNIEKALNIEKQEKINKAKTELREQYQKFWNILSQQENQHKITLGGTNPFRNNGHIDHYRGTNYGCGILLSRNMIRIEIATFDEKEAEKWKSNVLFKEWELSNGSKNQERFLLTKIITDNWHHATEEKLIEYANECIQLAMAIKKIT